MIFICNDSEKRLNFYYSIKNGQIYAMRHEGGDTPAGAIAGVSVLIYVLVRKINVYFWIDIDGLYYISVVGGIIAGALILIYFLKRLKHSIGENAYQYTCEKAEMERLIHIGKKQLYTNLWLIAVMLLAAALYRWLLIMVEPGSIVFAFFNMLLWIINILLIGGFINTKPFARLKFYRDNN